MNIKIISLLVAVILSFIGVAGDFFIKLAGKGKIVEWKWLILGMIIYASTSFGWFYAMRNVKLSILGVYYAIFTILFLTVLDTVYFHDRLSFLEIVGIALAIISLIILARFA